jgi:hypothetical protein
VLEGASKGNVTGALPDKTVEGVAKPQARGTEWLIIPIAALLILIVAMTIMNRRTIKGKR